MHCLCFFTKKKETVPHKINVTNFNFTRFNLIFISRQKRNNVEMTCTANDMKNLLRIRLTTEELWQRHASRDLYTI